MPEVEETTAYGMPAFKAGKTRFAGQPVAAPRRGAELARRQVSFEERDRLIAARPDVYYLTEHFANYPAVLARVANMQRDEPASCSARHGATQWSEQGPAKKKRPAGARGRR